MKFNKPFQNADFSKAARNDEQFIFQKVHKGTHLSVYLYY